MKKRLVVGFFLFFLTGSMLAGSIASPQRYPVDPLPPSRGPIIPLSGSPFKGVNITRPSSPSSISFQDKILITRAQVAGYKAQLEILEKNTQKSAAIEKELQQIRMQLKLAEDFLKNPRWWSSSTPPIVALPRYVK